MNFECIICTENGDTSGSADNGLCAITPCGHVFHIKCNAEWIRTGGSKTCATCRRPFRSTVTLFGSAAASEAAAGETAEVDSSLAGKLRSLEADFRESLQDARQEALRADKYHREAVTWAAHNRELETQLLEQIERNEELETKIVASRNKEFKLSLFEEKYPNDSVEFEGLMNQAF